ncbi:MAG: hypothetical protein V4436_00260 [Patescibacteria group bacterium]
MTASQLSDLFRQIGDGSIGGQEMQAMIEHRNPWEKPKLFDAGSLVSVGPLTKRFDPKSFFRTREGLYVWNDMSQVLEHATPTDAADASMLGYANLSRNAYDREIKAELPENHEVELWHIAELIKAQPGGKDGLLLNNGYANIFYVGGFAVHVYWSADDRGWFVNGWALGGGRWGAGSRVFSRN